MVKGSGTSMRVQRIHSEACQPCFHLGIVADRVQRHEAVVRREVVGEPRVVTNPVSLVPEIRVLELNHAVPGIETRYAIEDHDVSCPRITAPQKGHE